MKYKKLKISLLLSSMVLLPAFLISCSNNKQKNENKDNDTENGGNIEKPNPEPNPEPNPDTSNDELNSEGGEYNGLNVDAYLVVIKSLRIDNKTILSKLDNKQLNENIHSNPKFKNLSLEIQRGSNEENGVLELKLLGKYNNHVVNAKIKVSGFDKKILKTNKLSVFDVKINYKKWFELKQPVQGKSDLSFVAEIKETIALFENLKVNLLQDNEITQTISLEDVINNYKIKKMNLSLKSNDSFEIDLELSSNYKEYLNNQWVDSQNQVIAKQPSNVTNQTPLPSLNNLKELMLSSLEFNKKKLANYYASYFYGDFLYNLSIFAPQSEIVSFITNKDEVWNLYKSTYFPDKEWYLQITKNKDEFIANDINHSLSFSIYLLDETNQIESSISKSFTIDTFKSTKDLNQKKYQNDFYIKNNSILMKQIKNIYMNEIKNVYTTGKTYNKNIPKLPNLNPIIFNYEIFNQTESSSLKPVTDNFDFLSIFGQHFVIENSNSNKIKQGYLNIKNGLFVINDSPTVNLDQEAIFINTIELENNNINLTIEKDSKPNGVNLNFKTKINIESASNKTYSQDVNIKLFISSNALS